MNPSIRILRRRLGQFGTTRLSVRLHSAILFLTFLILHGVPVFAQDPPAIAMGINSSATYHAADFDYVDMATGRLNLRIPLVVDQSQRGKLNFTVGVTFSSSGVWQIVYQGSFIKIQPSEYGIPGPAIVQEGSLHGLHSESYKDPAGHLDYATWEIEDGYGIGPLHPMGPHSTGGSESIDGSGISYSSTGTSIHKEGFSDGQDTNGNEMTSGGTYPVFTTTDTLGRTWTTTYNSSNVSGCPTGGPIAPTTSTIWTVPGPANTVRTFKFCYSTYNIHTNFNCNLSQYTASPSLMTGIVLPDGTTWRFDYDNNSVSYGDLLAVYPPTGGHISYTWSMSTPTCDIGFNLALRSVATRTVFDGTNSNQWSYNWSQGYGVYTVTEPMQPVGNDTAYTNGCGVMFTGCLVTQIQYYSGSRTTGTLLKTVNKTYTNLPNPYICDMGGWGPGPYLLSGTTTVWPNGEQSQVLLTYDSGFTFIDNNTNCHPRGTTYTSSFGLVTSESHSDYYTGNPTTPPLLSVTNTNYLALSNPSYAAANILDLPSSVILTDGSGNKCAETDYGYDEYSPDASGVTMQHVAAPNSVMGNLTSLTKQLFTSPCSTPTPSMTPLKTTYHVYDTGMRHTTTDSKNNPPTTYTYSGTYYGAYPTSVCNALNQCATYGYDFNTGLMISLTDPNHQPTTWSWDCMLRATQANYPDGGQDTISFSYAPSSGGCGTAVTSTFASATLTQKITSSLNKVTTQIFDGLGRQKQTKAVAPTTTCSSGYIYTDTTYDPDGRKFSVSNPYCTTSDVTYGVTKTYYDPLNRPCLIVPPDGVTPSTYSCPATSPGNDILTTYLGNATTVADQAGIQSRSVSDGIGRLIEADEPGPGTGTATDATATVSVYGYEQAFYINGTTYTYDSGTVSITVNGHSDSVSYGQNSTPSTIASALASAINSDNNAPVTASVSGTYITLASKATGSSSDYPLSVGSSSTYVPTYLSVPSFFASAASPNLNCGGSGSSSVYSVCTPIVTTYAYDALSNLTSVLQAGSHQRIFNYDSLARVTQATNPESGATSYSYDANGNVLTKTDARGITANYSPSNATIDPLNRVRGKTYSNGDPEITYAYDGNAPVGCTPPALSDPYPIGRRTSMCDAAGSETWSHDQMGRVMQDERTTNSVTKTTTYATPTVPYNYDGSIAQLTYPSGRTITYTPNVAAQPISAVDTANSINYAMMVLYAPQGDLRSLTNGNGAGILSTVYYNNRLQPCRIAVNSSGTAPSSCGDGTNHGNVQDYTYTFDLSTVNGACSTGYTSPTNNGDVASIADNITSAKSQDFCYDAVNRLAKAETVSTSGSYCWGEQYGYDNWGNLLSIAAITPQYNGCTQESGFSVTMTSNPPTNQIVGFCYDADGNLLAQSVPPCTIPTYSYNGQNQMISTAGVTYTYDGDGRRVEKSNGKLYWYATGGNVLDETDASGNLAYEYIFFGGKRIARRDSSSNIEYYFADHLGSARVVTNPSGSALETCTYYPFGGSTCQPSSVNTYLFTGKERDGESGLDNFGARYDSSQYGRFTTPDSGPSGVAMADPQSWNLYSYARNRPTRFIDVGGNWATDVHSQIVTFALQNYLSAGELGQLVREQYVMDADQSVQSRHAMANPNQDPEEASNDMWKFVADSINGSNATLDSNGNYTSVSLDWLGDAMHTVEDYTSPEHTSASGQPMVWRGFGHPFAALGHYLGEDSPAVNWVAIGKAIRLTMAVRLESNAPCEAGKTCLTEQNFEREYEKNITDYVSWFYMHSGNDNNIQEEADRQCILGNLAACDH